MIHPLTADLLRLPAQAQVRCWLIGGNAVELVVGADTRPHDDVDLLLAATDGERAAALLVQQGFRQVHGSLEEGNVFYQRADVVVDLVPIDTACTPPRTLGHWRVSPGPPGCSTLMWSAGRGRRWSPSLLRGTPR